MNINTNAIGEGTLALLYLTPHDHYRAWKGFDWDVLNRCGPVSKTKSVVFTEQGLRESERFFKQHFVLRIGTGNNATNLLLTTLGH